MFDIRLTGFETELDLFKDLADTRKIKRMVNREIAPPIERRLDAVLRTPAPPRPDEKYVWSFNRAANRRAQRWWFAQIKKGSIPTDGSHYLRSNTIINAWVSQIITDGDTVIFTIGNSAPGAEHLYGSPTQNQNPSHFVDGWPHYTTFTAFFDQIIPEIVVAWEKLVRTSIKRKR